MMASTVLRLHLPLLAAPHKIPFSFLSSRHRILSSSSSLAPIFSPPFLRIRHAAAAVESEVFPSLENLQGDERNLESDNEISVPHQVITDPAVASLPSFPSPDLTVKEKKELASYAHSLGKKLKSQLVGKSGVTPSVAAAFVENLECNELLKIKMHGSCPGELSDTIKQLEASTGSIAVTQIGRSVILYRPSISKMKKKEAQSARKDWNMKPRESSTTFETQKKGKWSPRQHQSRYA